MRESYPLRMFPKIIKIFCLMVLAVWCCASRSALAQIATETEFGWKDLEQGYAVGRYALGSNQYLLRPEVILLKFDPELFSFHNIRASSVGAKRSDVKTLTEKAKGLAGINTNFFDEFENPLGLIVDNQNILNKMHNGGGLLTGVFLLRENKPAIVKRTNYSGEGVQFAIQAGPRLIANGKALKLSFPKRTSRRSGIAITKSGEVILFSTLLRFPGASFDQIQHMLLDKRLDITDALNFDGGGSSQMFIKKNKSLKDDTLITGGDTIPVAMVVKRRSRGTINE